MFQIKRLIVHGFRGFADSSCEFNFDSPITILFGGNHQGKSSTLNAIEWCLFGDNVTGNDTDIRERVNWVIQNRDLANLDVCVEIELHDGQLGLVARRSMKKVKTRTEKNLELIVNEAETVMGDEAEAKLVQLFGTSFRDFMTTTYLHQEAIRDILTQLPRQRNDAIDRLLGLTDYNNLLTGIKDGHLLKTQRSLAASFKTFESKVAMMLAARQVEVKEKYHNAKVAGLTESQLTPDGAIAVCDEVKQAIEAFVSEMGLSSRLLKVPDDWNAVPIFVTSVKKEVVRLRSEVPGIAEQTSLQQRKAKISELQTAYNQTYSLFIQMEKLVTDLNETTGSDVKLQTELVELVNLLQQKKDELSATGKRTELVRAGIDYLEKADSTKLSGKCPLCRNSTANLLENLKSEWETELESLAGHIRAEITKLQTRHGELTNALENLTNIKRKQVEAKNSLQTNRDAVGVFLGKTLAKEDDPLVLLKVELRQIDERLGELAQILNDRQGKLSNVDQKLELAMLIVAVLAAENKVETIQKLELSQESQEIDAIRDKCAIFIEDVRQIEDAVTRVLAEEAKTKIDGASLKIQDFFRRIADHPGLQSIQVVVDSKKSTGQNDYKFFDEQQRDITPILSQGDYNALALAIFLGLGVAAGDAGKFGFLILDDPSQSLAPEHQRRLVKILDEVSACRNIIISSMDDGFRGLLADGLTRMKKIFEYRDWTPTTGPKVTCK